MLCQRKGLRLELAQPLSHAAYQQQQFDLLAKGVRKALNMEKIYQIMGMA